MATENIIPGQNSINVRYFNLGKGAFDSKLAVLDLTELNELIVNVGGYFDDGNLIWVMSERKHYIINNDGTTVTAELADIGTGTGAPAVDAGFMYYGGQQHVFDYNVQGLPASKPSTVGYKHNDMIISSGGVVGTADGYEQYNAWRIEINNFGESYNYEGSIRGSDGDPGDKGEKGDKGEAFIVNAQGTLADRPACTGLADGYSYLVTSGASSGEIFFVIAGDPCSWSTGVPFGKGDPGASTWTVFKRSETVLIGGDQPSDSLVQADVDNGWTDGVPAEDGDPNTEDILYMSQAVYAVVDDTANPVLTSPDVFTWTSPIQVEGKAGIDGREGRDAGFWVVWSEAYSKPIDPINKPEKNLLTGEDTWAVEAGESWFDDIDYGNVDKDDPRWIAQTSYNILTDTWGPWVVSQVGGERPSYKLNLFTRSNTQPSDVTTDIPYYSIDKTFTDGTEAAILVNADVGVINTWYDSPPAATDPVTGLWFIEVFVTLNGPNTSWTTPIKIDGEEGDKAGIWSVWTDDNSINEDSLPLLQTADTIIDNENDTIDLTGSTGWYDTSTGVSVWMATTYFRKGSWSSWTYMKVKGEKGDPGVNFTVNAQGSGAPTNAMYCVEAKGFAYLDTDTSLLYFKTTEATASPCTSVGWTSGTPFGKGDGGEGYYNIFSASPSNIVPTKPANETTKEDAILLSSWNDSPPVLTTNERLWMSNTSYSKDSAGNVVGSIIWSTPVMIDGEEGVTAGYWTVWNVASTYTDLPPIKTLLSSDYTTLNLTGTGWIDDTTATTASVVWMSTAYYRPAKADELGSADANGWIWTQWVYAKVLGEDGDKGVPGDAAYTYIPNTMFILQPKDVNLANYSAVGGCLIDYNGVFTINMTGGVLIDGDNYTVNNANPYLELHDGIPTSSSEERVWMIQGVFNSNDNVCPNTLNWGFPSLLRDTAGMDYKYHRGDGSPEIGEAGTKPALPNVSMTGWYENPDDVPEAAYWIAQKNWSEGPSAVWIVYQIRGEDGKDSAPTVFFSVVHPYDANNPTSLLDISSYLEDPTHKPELWRSMRDESDHFYADNCSSFRASYYVCEKIDGTEIPVTPSNLHPDWTTIDEGNDIGGYKIYSIQRTDMTPAVPQKEFLSNPLVRYGNKIDTTFSKGSSDVRLAIIGDTMRFTDSGSAPDNSTDFIDGLTVNNDVECIGYPSIFTMNWKDKLSGNTLYMKYRMSSDSYATSASAQADLNDAFTQFKTYKFIGEDYQPTIDSEIIDTITSNPIFVTSGSTWYIGVSEYDWNKNSQEFQSQYLVEMNLDGTVKSWGFIPI